MEEPILARKTVTKTYVIGEHECATLVEAKIFALEALFGVGVMSAGQMVQKGPEIAAILLSKGHKKRGPRKKKVPPADPLAAHPTLPGIAPAVTEVRPIMFQPVAVPLAVPKAPASRNPIVPVLPGASTPDLGSIPMPGDL